MSEKLSAKKLKFFSFLRDDEFWVKSLSASIHLLLKRTNLKAHDVYMTAIILRVLERLPLITKNVGIELSLGTDPQKGSHHFKSLIIDDESICLRHTTVIYDPAIGSDIQSSNLIEIGEGWRDSEADHYDIEDWVNQFKNFAEDDSINVSYDDFNESEIDWHDEMNGKNYWPKLDNYYA
jgi:hypothetical protein